MLTWPKRAHAAIRKLFEPLQDIDVYVEDTNDEPFYGCLLKFAAGGSIQIARVFGLGGRKAVVDRAATHDHTVRRALFIIDGDFDWVKGTAAPAMVGLHRHDAYCIENLLLCEQAIRMIVSQELAISEDEAGMLLNYAVWRLSIVGPLIELFAAYATLNDFDATIPTVSKGVGMLCTNDAACTLDSTKVRAARDAALQAATAAADQATVTARYNYILARLAGLDDGLRAVSGKDFVFPLLQFRLNGLGLRIRTRAMRMRLATGGDSRRFSGLSDALRSAANGYL